MKLLRLASALGLLLLSFSYSFSRSFIKTTDGVLVYPTEGATKAIRLNVVSDKIIHVSASPTGEFSKQPSLMALPYKSVTSWKVTEKPADLSLETSSLQVIVSKKDGHIRFADKAGNSILDEQTDGKHYSELLIDGKKLYKLSQRFSSPADEAFYGLGQHQAGVMNYRGENVTLLQQNSDVAVPFLLSSKNYGLLWDNYSITHFGDGRSYQPLSAVTLVDKKGNAGGLTASYYVKGQSQPFAERAESDINYYFLNDQANFPKGYTLAGGKVVWEGELKAPASGKHQFEMYSGGYVKVWLAGKEVADVWRQSWNPASTRFDLEMEAGKSYPVKIEWNPDGGESYLGVKCMLPANEKQKSQFVFESEAGEQIDYYFVSGNDFDEVIAGYRDITGKAAIFPKWAYGFWQSRERYKTQNEILETVAEYRKRKIGLDNIVLDWNYWKEDQWGSHEFDQSRFPDAAGMIKALHEKYHTQFMISVWPKFYVNTDNYKLLDSKGWIYKDNVRKERKDWIGTGYLSSFYDAFNANARQLFWNMMNEKLYSKGVDAWWMDATEPDIHSNVSIEDRKDFMNPTALGSSTQYFNAYALENAKGVYEGQRQVDANKRVFILTRSAYAGMQRYAAATWSGDIGARWRDMKNQVAAGINFGLSGMPYWTQDIGGFSVEKRYEHAKGEDLDEWREQFTRWYQFGAFNPVFRAHGQFPLREIYNVAPEGSTAYNSMLYYNQLRYRLMPYIYSLAGQTYLHNYTIMRGLMMDFPNDDAVKNINDQYLFGPALLVNPVTEYKAKSRQLYLPKGNGWYDAYTGKYSDGGMQITADAPYERMPLYIKAGSIVPMGPAIQYVSEKPSDTLTVFVYQGSNGSFELYEDDGLNYDYEKGKYSTILLSWDDAKHVFSIGKRNGAFQGMLSQRVIRIIPVSKTNPHPFDPDQNTSYVLPYNGTATSLQLQ